MRPTNIEWITRRIVFIRKLSEKTGRQREIIRLLDIENRTSLEQKQLHVLATAEKKELQQQETQLRLEVQERIAGRRKRRERNHQMFLSAGLLTESGIADKKTGKLNYDREMLLRALSAYHERLSAKQKKP